MTKRSRTGAAMLDDTVVQPLKRAITGQIIGFFNDRARGEAPVARQPEGLFGPQSVAWRVHGDVTSMMVGGVSGLLLQMLHPAVLAGVWDHSNFRADMHGRLRRTARFIATTTYGDHAAAEAAINRVRGVHAQVEGTLADGTPYRANDPELLAWVHVTEAIGFLTAWVRYAEPSMDRFEQDRYFREIARVGLALGADPVPNDRGEAWALVRTMRPRLRFDARTRTVARLIMHRELESPMAETLQALAMQAAVDLLPAWARRMHGLPSPALSRPLIRAGTFGVAQTVRWAFRR